MGNAPAGHRPNEDLGRWIVALTAFPILSVVVVFAVGAAGIAGLNSLSEDLGNSVIFSVLAWVPLTALLSAKLTRLIARGESERAMRAWSAFVAAAGSAAILIWLFVELVSNSS